MTKQEYLDLLVATSKAGKFPARNEDLCCYRTPDCERSCAVGLLIPDEMYKPSMEGRYLDELVRDYPEVQGAFPEGMTLIDLRYAQAIHDSMRGNWCHDTFMARLLALPCFRGMTPTAA